MAFFAGPADVVGLVGSTGFVVGAGPAEVRGRSGILLASSSASRSSRTIEGCFTKPTPSAPCFLGFVVAVDAPKESDECPTGLAALAYP